MSSDIAWGLWNRHSGGSLSNINYFFSVTIVNSDTRKIIGRAMRNAGQEYVPKAPGYTFRPGTDDFLALIGKCMAVSFFKENLLLATHDGLDTYSNHRLPGSPNLVAACYFLAQHKAQFGHNRIITAITLFEPSDDIVSMCVKVERAPPHPPSTIHTYRPPGSHTETAAIGKIASLTAGCR
jgi:hypothetical protein